MTVNEVFSNLSPAAGSCPLLTTRTIFLI
ncbi:MAG: hypothetical protein RL612_810, partial [Actinomycetota bacterium]